MQIVGETTVDRGLFREMFRAQMRPTFQMLRLAGALVAVLAVLLWLLDPASVLTIMITVLAPLCLLLPEVTVELSWRRLGPLFAEPWRYEVTEASVSVATALLRQQFPWDSFVAIEHTPTLWVLRHKVPSVVLTVAKAAFAPSDQAEIERLIGSRGLVPAGAAAGRSGRMAG